MPAEADFVFTFSVSGADLSKLGARKSYTVPQTFVTTSRGLAFTWELSLYPTGCTYTDVDGEEAVEDNFAVEFCLLNGADFGHSADEVDLGVRQSCRLTANGHQEVRDCVWDDFASCDRNLVALVAFYDIDVPSSGHLTACVRVTHSPLEVEALFPPLQTLQPEPLGIAQALLAEVDEEDTRKLSDVRILCSDGDILGSWFNLARSSAYYAAVFRNNTANGLDTATVDHTRYRKCVVAEFLRCVYSGGLLDTVMGLNIQEKMDLLTLSDEVDTKISSTLVSALKREVTLAAISGGTGTAKETLSLLNFARLHDLHLLANAALTALSCRMPELPLHCLPASCGKRKADDLRLGPADWASLCRRIAGQQCVSRLQKF